MPGALAASHVEKVIIEALEASRLGLLTLRAVPEKTQRRHSARRRIGARHPTALHRHRVTGQREADDGDAGRSGRSSRIGHETICRIAFLQEVLERGPLEPLEKRLVRLVRAVQSRSRCCKLQRHRSDPVRGHNDVELEQIGRMAEGLHIMMHARGHV